MASVHPRAQLFACGMLACALISLGNADGAFASDRLFETANSAVDFEGLFQATLANHPQRGVFESRYTSISSQSDLERRSGGHTMIEAGVGLMTGAEMPSADMYRVELMHTLANFASRRGSATRASAAQTLVMCEAAIWENAARNELIRALAALNRSVSTLAIAQREIEFLSHQQRLLEAQSTLGSVNEGALLGLQQARIRVDLELRLVELEIEKQRSELARLTGLSHKVIAETNPSHLLERLNASASESIASLEALGSAELTLRAHQSSLEARRAQLRAENRPEWSIGAMYQLSPMAMGHDALVDSHEFMVMSAVTLPKPQSYRAELRVVDAELSQRRAEAQLAQFETQNRFDDAVRELRSVEAQEQVLTVGLRELQSAFEALSTRSARFSNVSPADLVATQQAMTAIERELVDTQRRKFDVLAELNGLTLGAIDGSAPQCGDGLEGFQ